MWRQRLILVHNSTDSFIALIVSTVLRSFDRPEVVNFWINPQSRSERFQMDSEGTSRFLPQLLFKVFASNIAKARQARLSKSWRFVFKWSLISWTFVGKIISHSYILKEYGRLPVPCPKDKCNHTSRWTCIDDLKILDLLAFSPAAGLSCFNLTLAIVETSLKLGNNMVLLSVKHKEKTMDRRVNK